jgi:hypothetical protein
LEDWKWKWWLIPNTQILHSVEVDLEITRSAFAVHEPLLSGCFFGLLAALFRIITNFQTTIHTRESEKCAYFTPTGEQP